MKQRQTLPTAQSFAVNTFYERLLDLRRTDPKAFGEISPASKLSLYAYETAKREHARLQAIAMNRMPHD